MPVLDAREVGISVRFAEVFDALSAAFVNTQLAVPLPA
jgi:hypothetical protein